MEAIVVEAECGSLIQSRFQTEELEWMMMMPAAEKWMTTVVLKWGRTKKSVMQS